MCTTEQLEEMLLTRQREGNSEASLAALKAVARDAKQELPRIKAAGR